MATDIVIGAAMRANLLSLQKTNSLLDSTQLRLSTGRKVNSALDGAQAFFSAQSLTNRAGDLSRLLDGMGQSIQTIKQADKSVTAMTKLVEQADSIAQQARDEVASATQEAKVTGAVNLKGTTDLTQLSGVGAGTTTNNTSTMLFSVTKADGTAVTLSTASDEEGATAGAVDIKAGDSIEQLVTKINDLNQGLSENIIEAKLNDAGQLEIKALNGASLAITFQADDDGGDAENDAANVAFATGLGFGNVAQKVGDGTLSGTDAQQYDVKITSMAVPSLTSVALYQDNSTNFAQASDLISAASGGAGSIRIKANSSVAGDAVFNQGATLGDKIVVGYNGKTSEIAIGANTSVQGLVDGINNDSTLKGKIEASYDSTTGKLNIRAIDASVTSIQFGIEEITASETSTAKFGFGVASSLAAVGNASGNDVQNVESVYLGASAGNLAKLEQDYNKLRTQIDQLADDAGYRGTNLLNGDSMVTAFNEDRTTSLTTTGTVFSADGLGLNLANFGNVTKTDSVLTDIREALGLVRNFGASLANDLAVMQAREDFTKQTIETLSEGADKLTLADMNEEGAKMLALQTRLQLGVTSLSLASQSAQSVLSLF